MLDGKRLRGSQEDGARGLHLLEAFVAEGKRILEQDEAGQVGRLLERLGLGELNGVVVIGDAAGAGSRGDDLFILKGNQAGLLECVGARSGRTGWCFLG